jgi:hypothetical protein
VTGYERPTERGTAPGKVIFWATISHTVEGQPVPYARVSPSFGTQPELVGWIRAHRDEGDDIAAWKRTSRGQDFHDERLSTRDEPASDPARLRALFEELARMLDAKKRDLDRGRRAA